MPLEPLSSLDLNRLQHILFAARDIAVFIQGRTRADLDSNAMFRRALLNAIQEIGEAAANLSIEGRNHAPQLPWGKIVQTRNILVHVYWGIDLDQVWGVAVRRVPELIAVIEPILQTSPPQVNPLE